jgi:L-malate glycosyltransferase
MKLLVISHPCTLPSNQQFFADVESLTSWKLTLLTPLTWSNEYSQTINAERLADFKGKFLHCSVGKSGNIPLHFYRSLIIPILLKLRPDAIYVHHEPYGVATSQIYLANLLSIRKPIGFFTWQNIYKNYPAPFNMMEQFVIRNSDFAFPGSYSAQDVIRKKGYQGVSAILPSGINPKVYYPRDEAKNIRLSLGIQQDEILVGYVGRIIEEKGLKTLLMALKKIETLPWKLVMIGSGSLENEFDNIAASLNLNNRIHRLGYINHTETPQYLSSFDVLVLPSETRPNWKEQFGRVIIEAMACGTPVLGSDSGEIPNLIQITGGGLVFSEGNEVSLAEQLEKLIVDTSLRNELRMKGEKKVLSNYTNITLASQFAEAILASIHQRSRN